MKKLVFACAALLALTLTVSPAKACNNVVGANFAQASVYGGTSFAQASLAGYNSFARASVGFNPAVTVVNHGFAFNAFTPAVVNVPQVVVQKNVVVNKNVVKQRARVKTKTVTKTRVR